MCSIKSSTHALIAAVGQFGAGYKFRRVAVLAVGGRFWGRPKLKLEELVELDWVIVELEYSVGDSNGPYHTHTAGDPMERSTFDGTFIIMIIAFILISISTMGNSEQTIIKSPRLSMSTDLLV